MGIDKSNDTQCFTLSGMDAAIIQSVDVLRKDKHMLLRVRSVDGVEGFAYCNARLAYLLPILQELITPYFVGKDARLLNTLIHDAYRGGSNYKLAGLAFWNCIGHLESALLDLLGKVANQPVGALLGEIIRTEVPVYMSSLRRDTTAEEEIGWLAPRVAEVGATAVKFKIGGRMNHNKDAHPGRTEAIIPLARRTFGDEVAIYVDANGSYDAEYAIEVGHFLEDYAIDLYEEPCPFTDFFDTKRVADALDMPVSGGEQDTNMHLFEWMITARGVDVIQPDIYYCGGILRCLQVAQMAAAVNMPVMPHCPKNSPECAAVFHFASIVPNLGPYQEYRAVADPPNTWYTPDFAVVDGQVRVPTGPGLGVAYDRDFVTSMTIL
ncbi:MAG: mandelate racemase/muconate lactonizing enzyme family protein [Chloroflexota bacterium]